MAQRYFKSAGPGISINLPDGTPWKNWTKITHDLGVIAPQSQYLIDCLASCVAQGIGGVEEITVEQFEEIVKKKPSKELAPRWREEWKRPTIAPSTAAPSQPVPPVRNQAVAHVADDDRKFLRPGTVQT
jgi:hypothetical protein